MEGVLRTPSHHIEAPALVAHSQGRGAPRRIGAPSSVDARKAAGFWRELVNAETERRAPRSAHHATTLISRVGNGVESAMAPPA